MFRAVFWLWLAAVTVGGGCVLIPEPYEEPSEYDLTAPAPSGADAERVAVPVKFGVFRNMSGSDRRFLVRLEGDRLQSDEYNRWLLIPEQLIMRRLCEELGNQPSQGEAVRVDATIYRFEFDRARGDAVFGASFTLRRGTVEVYVDAAMRSPLADGSPGAVASAMSRCVSDAAMKLRAAISANWGSPK